MKNLLFILLFGILASASIPALAQTIPISPVAVCLPPDSVAPDRLILRFAILRKFYDSATICTIYINVASDSLFSPSSQLISSLNNAQIYTSAAGGYLWCAEAPRNNDTIWISVPFRTPTRPPLIFYRLQMGCSNRTMSLSGISLPFRVDMPRSSTPPSIPQILRPIGITNNAMTVMWNKAFGSIASDTMRYTVQLSSDSTFRTETQETITSDTTAKFSALKADTRYF